ncbi:hypothetical protein [Acidiphilium acidophilum]|uniref:hypothetical protein n=1 Tax=Acidiphilium acidophilum TaxID=76588 RepID=UPI0029CA5720|nr:hypothetical protein [Acidiphilium acidophilum]
MISKSLGVTATERLLAQLCDRTFLRLWSYANPFRSPGTEMCDLIAISDENIFLFFDREVRISNDTDDLELAWTRWHKKVITDQINTARGAKRHITSGRPIFSDPKCKNHISLPNDRSKINIFQIIIAHGAKEACEGFSTENVYGSMAIGYGDVKLPLQLPFMISLNKDDPTHVLDSHNLEIILKELDTIKDLTEYFVEKERVIKKYDGLVYAGEEDLLAHYFLNFDDKAEKYRIGPQKNSCNFLVIGEGEWKRFAASAQYRERNEANKISYLWDRLIQKTSRHILDGTALGNTTPFGPSAVQEMAKEGRLARRALANGIAEAINSFPYEELDEDSIQRKMIFMTSFDRTKGYVFLQIRKLRISNYDIYRTFRQNLLKIACGSAKNKFPDLKKIVGIATDAPRFAAENSEDLILLECEKWSDEDSIEYKRANELTTPLIFHKRRSCADSLRFSTKRWNAWMRVDHGNCSIEKA